MRSRSHVKKGKATIGVAALTLVVLASLVMPLAVTPVEAHMPGAKAPPEFELEPIVISDGGKEIEITIEDTGNYHNETMKSVKNNMLKQQGKTDEEIAKIIEEEFAGVSGICVCLSGAFRMTLLGISEIWGDEIPQRGDIKIIGRRPTLGAIHCLQYITGTGPNVPNVTAKGELHLILPDGTEVVDLSVSGLNKHAVDLDISYCNLMIIRKSTGEEFEIQVREDVFPEGFEELRKKVKFSIPEMATGEEVDEFRAMWEEVRDAFLTLPDWELFEGVEKPFPIWGATFFSIIAAAIFGGIIYAAVGRKR